MEKTAIPDDLIRLKQVVHRWRAASEKQQSIGSHPVEWLPMLCLFFPEENIDGRTWKVPVFAYPVLNESFV